MRYLDKKFYNVLIEDYLKNFFELQTKDSYDLLIKELDEYKIAYGFKNSSEVKK